MTSINRAPTGWLGFLGIKNGGRNPSQAGDFLSPTWDMSDLYLATNRVWITTGGNITATGAAGGPVVPQNQVWYVQGFCVFAAPLVAGNVLDFEVTYYENALQLPVTFAGSAPQFAPVVGSRPSCKLPYPLFMHPGQALGFFVNTFAGANIAYTLNMVYSPLEA